MKKQAPLLEAFEVFVNHSSFWLKDSEQLLAEKGYWSDIAKDRDLLNLVCELQKRFWNRLELKAAESYVAGGNQLIVATRNDELFIDLVRRLARFHKSGQRD